MSGHTPGDQLDLDLPPGQSCGYALTDDGGEEYPCDRPGVSWRWYQGHDHEDALDRACERHENVGGIRMAALVAEVRRLRARESYTVEQIHEAFAKHAHEDDWGVPSFYEGGLINALRGEYDARPF